MLKFIVLKKVGKSFNVPNEIYENKYCNQDDFSILVCGGYNQNNTTLNDVYELNDQRLNIVYFLAC